MQYLPLRALKFILIATLVAWIIGAILLYFFAGEVPSLTAPSRWGGLAKMLLTANAALVVGFILGMLFGVPMTSARSEAAARAEGDPTALRYRPNDQLQQVSDWLVKILLGAGLTQLTHVSAIGTYLEPLVGSAVGAMVIVVFFAVIGFICGYMTTILYFGPLIKRSGMDLVSEWRQEMHEIGQKAALEGFLFQSLYAPPPSGFEQAIRRAEDYLKSDPAGSADIFGHLACAYAQKYAWKRQNDVEPTAPEMKQLVTTMLDYARKAVERDPEWKAILKNLYDAGPGIVDNDWAVFKVPGNDPDGLVTQLFQPPKPT